MIVGAGPAGLAVCAALWHRGVRDVVLLGMDRIRLLAGLGLAGDDDPAQVALAVDRAWHGAGEVPIEALLATGARRWREARAILDRAGMAAAPVSGSLRATWSRALRMVTARAPAGAGAAELAYLTACWLRRPAVDDCADGPARGPAE